LLNFDERSDEKRCFQLDMIVDISTQLKRVAYMYMSAEETEREGEMKKRKQESGGVGIGDKENNYCRRR